MHVTPVSPSPDAPAPERPRTGLRVCLRARVELGHTSLLSRVNEALK